MNKNKISRMLLAAVISAASVMNVSAGVSISDIKAQILLSDTKQSDTNKFDTNNDGKVNVFDVCRLKKRIIYNIVPFDEESVYNAMLGLQKDYPEGMPWTNDNFYAWNGGIYGKGFGCAGFAFMLSDVAFGKLPARKIMDCDVSQIRVGDIIRVNDDTHSVIVLEINDEGVTIAEGNFNRSVHWGRKLAWTELKASITYVMTRYPLE